MTSNMGFLGIFDGEFHHPKQGTFTQNCQVFVAAWAVIKTLGHSMKYWFPCKFSETTIKSLQWNSWWSNSLVKKINGVFFGLVGHEQFMEPSWNCRGLVQVPVSFHCLMKQSPYKWGLFLIHYLKQPTRVKWRLLTCENFKRAPACLWHIGDCKCAYVYTTQLCRDYTQPL